MIVTTEVDRKARPAQLCPVAGARHLLIDRPNVLVVRLAPVLDRLQWRGRPR
jgi:hypothetical protein